MSCCVPVKESRFKSLSDLHPKGPVKTALNIRCMAEMDLSRWVMMCMPSSKCLALRKVEILRTSRRMPRCYAAETCLRLATSTAGSHIVTGTAGPWFLLPCRLTAAFEEHHQRERVNKGPQFVKGPTEQIKKPAFGLTTSGEWSALLGA